jgi:hypothetical protein
MTYKLIFILINILLFIPSKQANYVWWWIYEPNDHDEIFDEIDSKKETTFLNDQNICYNANYNSKSCSSVNGKFNSDPPFDIECCNFKAELIKGCYPLFKSKYHESSLYSLSKFAEKTVSYDCDGNGFKEYNSKDFNPAEPWEKVIKEKLDCIYSETENQCKSLPQSFEENTKCCWFQNDNYKSYSSCFGISDVTDKDFNRIVPYLSFSSIMKNGKMDFSCYNKNGKEIKGKYDMEYSISEFDSSEEKLLQEISSEENINILSEKQVFLGINEFDGFSSFQIMTISPFRESKTYTVSVKYSFVLDNGDAYNFRGRNLETLTDTIIAHCYTNDFEEGQNMIIANSECQFGGYKGTPINLEIEPGYDLIGNFNDKETTINSGESRNTDEEINKMKKASYFKFKYAINNLKSNTFEGATSEDRRDVNFILYHQKGETVETIEATANFLKNSNKITFTPKANIDFNEGVTVIPNQMCKSLDGNYLYIENNVKGDKQTNSNENNEQKRLEISLYMKLLLLLQMLSLILN